MSLPQYLELLDWTGRQLKPARRGSIPKNAPPILDRLNLSAELWLHAVEQFAKRRSAKRTTPASRFNATAKSVLTSNFARVSRGGTLNQTCCVDGHSRKTKSHSMCMLWSVTLVPEM